MKRLDRPLIIPGDLARKSDNNVKKQKRNKYMAQPINIEDLQNRRKVKAYKIGFKKGRTPADIYHSICSFINDFDNLRDILLCRRNVPTLFLIIFKRCWKII